MSVRSVERSVIRVIEVKRRDKVRLNKIKTKVKFKNVNTINNQLKWRWSGHIIRDKKEKWTKLTT